MNKDIFSSDLSQISINSCYQSLIEISFNCDSHQKQFEFESFTTVDSQQDFLFIFEQNKNKGEPLFSIFKNQRNRQFKIISDYGTYFQHLSINYNRKEKSLEELSKKFLSLFIDKSQMNIELDKITQSLGVERRRIYDIINILESLQLVSRKGKNNYRWNGLSKIHDTILYFQQNKDIKKFIKPYKKEKSLEILSIGFLNLFINYKQEISLQQAARKLSHQELNDHKIKTKIRRLYDIANVFKSLGILKKTILSNKKPGFKWIGLQGVSNMIEKKKCLNSQSQTQGGLMPNLRKQQLLNIHYGHVNPSDSYRDCFNWLIEGLIQIDSKDIQRQMKHTTPINKKEYPVIVLIYNQCLSKQSTLTKTKSLIIEQNKSDMDITQRKLIFDKRNSSFKKIQN